VNDSPHTIYIQAHRAQLEFMNHRTQPYVGFVGGRGAGKSFACAMKLYKWSSAEGGLYGMYAPTFPLLNDTILRVYLEMARPHIDNYDKSRQVIRMHSGSEILCRSLDDPERARGPSLRGAVWDEASLCSLDAFDILIGCLRYEGRQGWLACGFTPKGLNHWTAGVFHNAERTDSAIFHARTSDNPFNPPGFADTLRRQYTSAFARQEIDGSFLNMGGNLMQRQWFRLISPAEMPRLRAVTRYWDLAATPENGANDPDWTAGAKVGRSEAGQWVVLDMRHRRLTPAGNEMLVAATANEDGKGVRIGMEEEGGASGKSLVDHYRRRILMGFNFKGDRPTGDKLVRAMPFAAAAEAGNVLLLKGAWNKEFLDEAESFGPDCAHDDQIDACAGACNLMSACFIRPHVGAAPSGDEVPPAPLPQSNYADLLAQAATPAERAELEKILAEEGLVPA